MRTWEAHDPALTRPVAAPLEQCAKLLRVELSAVRQAAAHVEPYIRVDGTKVWSLTQLERRLRPQRLRPGSRRFHHPSSASGLGYLIRCHVRGRRMLLIVRIHHGAVQQG